MGVLEELKKKFQGDPYAKVEVLINEIDRMLATWWKKIDKEKVAVTGENVEGKPEFEFSYQADWDKVEVEMSYNHPYLEVAVKSPKKMMEHKITVSDFVERKGLKLKLKDQEELEKVVKGMVNKIEER